MNVKFSNRLAMGMALAEQLKVNDFVKSQRLQKWMKMLQKKGGKNTYIIYRGDTLIEFEKEFNPGLVAYWLGDKNGKYVFVREHDGVKLEGMASVQMYVTIMDGEAKIVMDVWPVSVESKPLLGTIWMADGFGSCTSWGVAPVFSPETLMTPLAITSFVGTVNGFCFGMVCFDDMGFDSQFVLSNMMERIAAELGEGDPEKALPLILTPFGAARGEVKSQYHLTDKKLRLRPTDMSNEQLYVIRCLFEDGALIISDVSARDFLMVKKNLTSDEAANALKVLKLAAEDGWLMEICYEDFIFYGPTPALYEALS